MVTYEITVHTVLFKQAKLSTVNCITGYIHSVVRAGTHIDIKFMHFGKLIKSPHL
jgi:hypothetical protein